MLFGRSPLALPRKAVGEIDRDGAFVGRALLPGRYEISVRVGARVLPITSGPREVEIPIEPGATVDLADTDRRRPAGRGVDAGRSAAQCRTRMRLRQSARTWWLSFSNEVKRTAMPATARLVPPCV